MKNISCACVCGGRGGRERENEIKVLETKVSVSKTVIVSEGKCITNPVFARENETVRVQIIY